MEKGCSNFLALRYFFFTPKLHYRNCVAGIRAFTRDKRQNKECSVSRGAQGWEGRRVHGGGWLQCSVKDREGRSECKVFISSAPS